ncbi:UPF0158 family protein [Saccharothrix sp. Mg75]|uniref:UPF0158 family protein n=1 Tax=Saccharothrix sp. Mg75 TaxID=3445357 RepID=UPI003EE82FBC
MNPDVNPEGQSKASGEPATSGPDDPLDSVQAHPVSPESGEGVPNIGTSLATSSATVTSGVELSGMLPNSNDDSTESTPKLVADATDVLLDTNPAFGLVQLAVTNLRSRGRRTTAAAVKTEMQRLSAGGFSESEYGHKSFRHFLVAAEKAGFIAVRLPAYGSGQDAEISMPQDVQPPESSTSSVRSIRPDIWSTFFDYRPDITRVFDLRTHRAAKFPIDPTSRESSDVSELRTRFMDHPNEFLVIEPVQIDEQLGWMKAFASETSEPERALLEDALKKEKPLAAFTSMVRSNTSLTERWNRFRLGRVTARVKDWMQQHGLEFDLYDVDSLTGRKRQRDQGGTFGSVTSRTDRTTPRSGVDSEQVRARVHRAVARMPLSELLQLRIPVEYILEP